jgi:hypothetical protein
MAAMERNSDLIKMQCYAPMFVNVNPGARQWRPNLIGYDAISAYGSPSYYALLTATAAEPDFLVWAKTPPMGWNSWDCYGAGVWESNVVANADYMAQFLKPHGWDIITIDIQWYEPLAHTDAYRRGAVLEMDANGRLLPATNRFPMTAATRSFKPIADYLHAKG